jgi:hypothetical protein
MYHNLLTLSSPRGVLYLLGAQDSEPRFSSLGYLAPDHSAPEGTVYTAPDADNPELIYHIVTLTPIKPGWWMWNSELPTFVLDAPAPFLITGDPHATP